MGLDDKVFAETNAEERDSRNQNLEGGKSSAAHQADAEAQKKTTKNQEKLTAPHKDPDELKSTTELLAEDQARKSDLSSGDSD